jgi:hypothetical protein
VALLARLQAGSLRAEDAGDATMLPAELGLVPWREVDKVFGAGFAERLGAAPLDGWAGPFASGFGLHLVRVRERADGAMPALAEVRGLVEREVMADRRRAQLAAMYDGLLTQYRVVVEAAPATPAASANAAAPPASAAARQAAR